MPVHNGLAFTGKFRGFEVAFETNLRALGITPITSRPYHPQTCGKVERFQQTLKRWLRAKHPARTLNELQHQLDHFVEIYNHRRPHRSLAGSVPFAAWTAQPAATASPTPIARARTSRKVTRLGTVFIQGKLIHIGKRHAGATAQLVLELTEVVYIWGLS